MSCEGDNLYAVCTTSSVLVFLFTTSLFFSDMVFFSCDGCAEILKKAKVDAHAAKCYDCASVSCVDCSVSFYGDDYKQHTSCVTEAERYEKSIYKGPKKGTKMTPQEMWVEVLYNAVDDAPTDIRGKLQALTELSVDNVPRKEKQFRNFVANSLKLRDGTTVSKMWQHLMKKKEQQAVAKNQSHSKPREEDENKEEVGTNDAQSETPTQTESKDKFHSESEKETNCVSDEEKHPLECSTSSKDVSKAMKKILKGAPNKSMKIKELRVQVQQKLPTCDKKTLKRMVEEQLQAKSSKKFKVEGKIASYIK